MTNRLCKPWEHSLSRRQLLGSMAGAAAVGMTGGLGGIFQPAIADEIKKRRMAAIEEMEATKRQKPQSKAEERFAETMTRMVQMSAVKLEAAQAPVPKAKTEKTV